MHAGSRALALALAAAAACLALVSVAGCPTYYDDDWDDDYYEVRLVNLYVDGAATVTPTGSGAGSPGQPFPRIADALARARTIRANSWDPIAIFVAPGTYANEPRPLILDVEDLGLNGALPVPRDTMGYPTTPTAGAPVTLLAIPTSSTAEPVIVIANDYVAVTSFVIDANPAGAGPSAGPGIFVDGTRDVDGVVIGVSVTDNFVFDAAVGVLARHMNGEIESNLLSGNGTGAHVGAMPGTSYWFGLVFDGNRCSGNLGHGASFAGDTESLLDPPVTGAAALQYVDVFLNDLSDNGAGTGQGAGLRFGVLDAAGDASQTATLYAYIANNRIERNAGYGLIVEHVLPKAGGLPGGACAQNFPTFFEGELRGNIFSANGIKNAGITFTTAERTAAGGAVASSGACYVESSVIDINDATGSPFGGSHDSDNPASADGRVLGNSMTLNGFRIDGLVRSPVP